jgi:lipopolysaccharide export system ATP-binding protein
MNHFTCRKSPLFAAQNLSKWFLRRRVVEDVSLDIFAGEIVGLLGTNGAGKTTVFRMAAGTLAPNKGRVLFDGHDVTKLPLHRRVRECRFGYLAQAPSVFGRLTAEDNLTGFLRLLGYSRKEALKAAEKCLADLDLQEHASVPAEQLSGGQKRRLEIARTLLVEPRIILMDEPFSGIDPVAIEQVTELIRRLRDRGIGILITEHRVENTLLLTDRCYVIHGGKMLVHGTPTEVLQHPDARQTYFGGGLDGVIGQLNSRSAKLAA